MRAKLFFDYGYMAKFWRILLVSMMSFLFVSTTYAIDAPTNLKVVNSTETQIDLSWDQVDGAEAYFMYYSLTEPSDTGYDLQWPDFINGTTVSITELKPDQNYYFAVVSVDAEANESLFSNEVSSMTTVEMNSAEEKETTNESEVVTDENVTGAEVSVETTNMETTDTAEVTSTPEAFALKKIEAVELDKIAVIFNAPLDESADTEREFKVVNKNDKFDVLFIKSTELDELDATKLFVTLDGTVELGGEYILTVTAIQDATGRTIESGIDSVETFTILEEDIKKYQEPAPVTEPVEPVVEPTPEVTPTESGSLAGKEVDASAVKKGINSADDLPQTGPEHALLALLAIIFTGLVAFRKRQA